MFCAGFVLGFLECGVADVDLALFAPEPGLLLLAHLVSIHRKVTLTADFQYSAMVVLIYRS